MQTDQNYMLLKSPTRINKSLQTLRASQKVIISIILSKAK